MRAHLSIYRLALAVVLVLQQLGAANLSAAAKALFPPPPRILG